MINNKDLLTSKSPTHLSISTATNDIFAADVKGSLPTKEIVLREAFASQALHENLLSVNQLAKDGYDTLFSKDKVYIGKGFPAPDQYQVVGKRRRGAYYVTLQTTPLPQPVAHTNRFHLLQENDAAAAQAVSTFKESGSSGTVAGPSSLDCAVGDLPSGGSESSVSRSISTSSGLQPAATPCGKQTPSNSATFPLQTSASLSNEYVAPPLNSMDVAHLRLNHLHEEGIRKLVEKSSIGNLVVHQNDRLNPCLACLQGKAKKGTPPASSSKTEAVGELIHMDLCGPIEPVSASGNRYILTATDDFSGHLSTWPIKSKGASFEIIKSFVNIFNNHHGTVKSIRTDRGGEFTSNNLRSMYDNLGIEQQLTIRHSPHQNPVSERTNLTIFGDIRACLISSGISWDRWDEALNSVTFTRNHCPKLRLDWQIPLTILSNRKPDFTILRVFGETCFAITQPFERRQMGSAKLAPRAVRGRFVGYTKNSKGYRVLLPSGKVMESTYSNTTFIPLPEIAAKTPASEDDDAPSTNHISFQQIRPAPSAITPAAPLSADEESSNESFGTGREDDSTDDEEDEEDHQSIPDVVTSPTGSDNGPPNPPALIVDPPQTVQNKLNVTAIPGREGFFKHPTKGTVQIQDASNPAPSSSLNPPAREKRESRKPQRYGSSKAASSQVDCSCCIAGQVAGEVMIPPAAVDILLMSSLEWLKEVQPTARSSRAASNDPSVPKNHSDIYGRDDESLWIKAEQEEIAQLIAMGTWELVPPPPGRSAIKNTWRYRKKTDANGVVTRYKARLCACGYSQRAGIDYKEVYSPVFRMESSRIFLSLIASRDMAFRQMDVTGAFLNGELEETIYMKQPVGYEDVAHADYVLLLLKNLYGLKQASRTWHQTIHPFLVELGFKAMDADPGIYFQWDEDHKHLQLISLYVDNLGIAADLPADVEHVRSKLSAKFKMTDEPDDQFLNMKIERTTAGFNLSQTVAIDALLVATNMTEATPASTPMDTLTVSKADCPAVGSDEWHHMQSVPYRETIGSLTHIARLTRPDISYSVSVASRYLANPGTAHWNHVKRILRYLKGTRDYIFKLEPGKDLSPSLRQKSQLSKINGPLNFHGYVDSDWGGELESAKSTTGYGFYLGNALVSWMSKTQSTTASSSTYAEYIAGYSATAECVWSRNFFAELGLLELGPTTLYCDNEAAIKIAKFHMVTPRSKHFDTKFHYVREQVDKKTLELLHCPGAVNVADIWTKALGKARFLQFRAEIGVVSPESTACQHSGLSARV